MSAMKWWGWGDEGVEFTHEDKPDLAPFIERVLGIRVGAPTDVPVRFEDLPVPEPDLPDGLRGALEQAVGAEFVSVARMDRVVHARGKSLRDLILQRRGLLTRVPDVVVRPASEHQVSDVMRAALEHDAVLIPFGGGSSISGSLEAPGDETRPVISVDLTRLDRLLDIDGPSRLARVQAGVWARRWRNSWPAAATPWATSPTRSRTPRWADGSPPDPRGCSQTATATSPTSPRACASSPRRGHS